MSDDRVNIRETLISFGVPKEHVAQEIRSGIFSWHARIFDHIRLLLGGNPYTPQSGFVQDIANCSSGAEIDGAFLSYRTNPDRRNRLVSRILGLTPRPQRVFKFYRKLKFESKQRRLERGSPRLRSPMALANLPPESAPRGIDARCPKGKPCRLQVTNQKPFRVACVLLQPGNCPDATSSGSIFFCRALGENHFRRLM